MTENSLANSFFPIACVTVDVFSDFVSRTKLHLTVCYKLYVVSSRQWASLCSRGHVQSHDLVVLGAPWFSRTSTPVYASRCHVTLLNINSSFALVVSLSRRSLSEHRKQGLRTSLSRRTLTFENNDFFFFYIIRVIKFYIIRVVK